MKLNYFLVIKGDPEQASVTLDTRRTTLPDFWIDALTEYSLTQTQVEIAVEIETVEAAHDFEAKLNYWLGEDTEIDCEAGGYPLGSLLFWHSAWSSSNTRELAEARGLKVFDTAYPQQWADAVREELGQNFWLNGNIVWSYDDARIYGKPMAATKMGDEILARLSNRLGGGAY